MEKGMLENLINKRLAGEASVEEINQLDKWYDLFDSQTDLYIPDSPESDQAVAKKFSEIKLILGIG